MTLDVDIICIPVTEKLPFVLKRAPVNGVSAHGMQVLLACWKPPLNTLGQREGGTSRAGHSCSSLSGS